MILSCIIILQVEEGLVSQEWQVTLTRDIVTLPRTRLPEFCHVVMGYHNSIIRQRSVATYLNQILSALSLCLLTT